MDICEKYGIDPALMDIIKKDGFVFKDDEHITWEGNNPVITFECQLPNGNKKQLSAEAKGNFGGELENACRGAVAGIMASSSDDYITNGYAVSALMNLLNDTGEYNDKHGNKSQTCRCACGCEYFTATETVRSEVPVKVNRRGKALVCGPAVEESRVYTQLICKNCGAVYDSLNNLLRADND